jgi:hypothetical protein
MQNPSYVLLNPGLLQSGLRNQVNVGDDLSQAVKVKVK